MKNMVYNPKGINPMAANAFAASTMACACGMVYGDVIQHVHFTQIRVVLLVTLLLVLPGDVTQHVNNDMLCDITLVYAHVLGLIQHIHYLSAMD
jgi:hypothetical protein